jgi:hypothetical protein
MKHARITGVRAFALLRALDQHAHSWTGTTWPINDVREALVSHVRYEIARKRRARKARR